MPATSLCLPRSHGIVTRSGPHFLPARPDTFRTTALAVLLLTSACLAMAQAPVAQQRQPRASSQPCATASNGRSCAQVRATPNEVREFLRDHARESRWKIGQEMSSANVWTFARHLEREELAQTAKTEAFGGHVTWTDGQAFVEVKTS